MQKKIQIWNLFVLFNIYMDMMRNGQTSIFWTKKNLETKKKFGQNSKGKNNKKNRIFYRLLIWVADGKLGKISFSCSPVNLACDLTVDLKNLTWEFFGVNLESSAYAFLSKWRSFNHINDRNLFELLIFSKLFFQYTNI